MMKRKRLVVGFWVLAILASGMMTESLASTNAQLPTVAHVDLKRYVGKWYEIARYPNRFQKDCAGDTSATYTLRPDGTVEVVNECRSKEGKTKRAVGTAKVTDRASNSKLKVTFFWPFYGKYWILDLGPEYEYAVVGEPSRKYLWILSREPRMDQSLYARLAKKIADVGYDPEKLVRTPQSGD
jgi:apolipoprotein D and lipocalin family protein